MLTAHGRGALGLDRELPPVFSEVRLAGLSALAAVRSPIVMTRLVNLSAIAQKVALGAVW